MSDEEIMKALECCGDPYSICAECPIKDDHGCNEQLANYALDLITRQKAETERLKKEIQITKDAYIMLQTKNEIIKSEAVKEFAKRLKCGVPQETGVIRCADVDNLVKEIVGEKEREEATSLTQ